MLKELFEGGDEIKMGPRFKRGEFAEFVDPGAFRYGEGNIKITRIHEVPEEDQIRALSTQWVEFSKEVNGSEMVYDWYLGQYVLPENLSEAGKSSPVEISTIHLRKVERSK